MILNGRLYGQLMRRDAWDEAREGVGRVYGHLTRREALDEAREGVVRLYGQLMSRFGKLLFRMDGNGEEWTR